MVVLRWWGAGGERWSGEEKKIAVCVLHSMDGRMGGLEGVFTFTLTFSSYLFGISHFLSSTFLL